MKDSTEKALGRRAEAVDDRFGAAKFMTRNLRKVFPDHASFMLGEIALYSFVILLLSGVYLTFFYQPSLQEVVYHGTYAKLDGVTMSQAYKSTVDLSFDVRGGLLMRQIHHWSALLFIAAIMVHMFRIFFTGAFRKPREMNWLIGLTMYVIALLEGFAGYTLPDDLLSGSGLRIFVSVTFLAIPVVGTYLMYFVFGGAFPDGQLGEFIPRLYTIHILLIPAVLAALVGAHMLILWHQKHTQFPGPKATNRNVVGSPMFPVFMAKTGAFFMFVFGVVALLATFGQINPIWLYGPYDPVNVTSGLQPDWYIGLLDGGLRMMPGAETHVGGYTIVWDTLVPALIVPGVLFTFLALYPYLEEWATGDGREHHLLNRPRNVPVRTGIGVAWITVYLVLWIAAGNDIIATRFSLSINTLIWTFRIAVFVLPVVAFVVTKRICIGLQRRDEHMAHEGVETGVIRRTPEGGYVEATRPPSPGKLHVLTAETPDRPLELEAVDGRGVEVEHTLRTRLRFATQRWYTQDNADRTDGHVGGRTDGTDGTDGGGTDGGTVDAVDGRTRPALEEGTRRDR